MQQIAEDVWQLPLAPREAVNAYLIGDLLVDAGMATSGGGIVKALQGRTVAAHTITHAHNDHVGGSRTVVDALGVPFWAPSGDAEAVERGRPAAADNALKPLVGTLGRFKALTVARRLQDGDEVSSGFVVVDSPGHSPGHIAFWRERDRVLVCGDVWFNMLLPRPTPGLREPFAFATPDPARNRASMRRLVELEPAIACFGHGPVLRDAAPRLRAFTEALPG